MRKQTVIDIATRKKRNVALESRFKPMEDDPERILSDAVAYLHSQDDDSGYSWRTRHLREAYMILDACRVLVFYARAR